MCGIAGIVHLGGFSPDRELLSRMTDTLAHRGPDQSGVEISSFCGFGHRRLSIIDLVGGSQPMYGHDRRFLITFNGEIFNYKELKQELLSAGASFHSESDTEVILEAARIWGPTKAFAKLNGQFAFALFDTLTRDVFLVRDRMGEKPLYFAVHDESLIFASETKALLEFYRSKGKQVALNKEAFWDYLSLNYIPGGKSFVDGIESVPAAGYLHIRHKIIQKDSYWSPDSTQVPSVSDIQSGFTSIFESAVSMRLRSDVPIGMYLSGGLDSTAALVAAKKSNSDLTAFIADFDESSFGEGAYARKVAKMLGIKSETVKIDFDAADIPAIIEKLVYHGDAPLADSSSLPVYLLSRETKRFVKVVVSGDGGDELFGGYLTYRATHLAQNVPQIIRKISPQLARVLSLLPASNRKVGLHEKLDRFLRNLDLPPAIAHLAWNGMWRTNDKLKLIHPDLKRLMSFQDTFEKLSAGIANKNNPKLSELLKLDQRTYLVDDILQKTDRMSMAHGLEVRPAFLDYRLVELSSSMSEHDRRDLCNQKKILKEYLKREFPRYDCNRSKQGFSIPVHLWFRTKLKDFTNDLFKTALKNSQLFDEAAVMNIWKQHQKRQRNFGFEIWGIVIALMFERKLNR